MNGRCLNNVFRCGECAIRTARREVLCRPFSSSPLRQRHGAIPTFTEVSSPELQDLFTKVRERIFLPAYVSQGQRDLIFKGKHKKSLEVEPVTAIVADEEFKLKHLDPLTDVPGKKSSLIKAMRLMQDKRDWDNLPNLLQGLKTAKFRFHHVQPQKVVSTAGKAKRQDVILECLRRGDETGLKLTTPDFVAQVFFWLHQKAYLSAWNAEETKKALHWAEMVKDMMAEPKHQPAAGSKPLVDLPEVNGILLELAAVRAAMHQDGKDVDGKVKRFALDLLASKREFEVRGHAEGGWNFWLAPNTAVAHGLRIAQTILGPASELSRGLKALGEKLEPLLEDIKNQSAAFPNKDGSLPTGVVLYEKLLSPETS